MHAKVVVGYIANQLERFMAQSCNYCCYVKDRDDTFQRFLSSVVPSHYPTVSPFLDHILYDLLKLEDEEEENENDDETCA